MSKAYDALNAIVWKYIKLLEIHKLIWTKFYLSDRKHFISIGQNLHKI